MLDLDMTTKVEGEFDEGWYHLRVHDYNADKWGSGRKLQLIFHGTTQPSLKVKDTLTFSGKAERIARTKITALGLPEDFRGSFDPNDLIDRGVFIYLSYSDWTPDEGQNRGKTYTSFKPDISQGTHSGYQPESNPPAGVVVPSASAPGDDLDDSTPF